MTTGRASMLVAVALLTATPVVPRAQDPPAQAPRPPAPLSAPASPQDQASEVYTMGRDRLVPPRVASQVKPPYTPEALQARVQGTIRLRGIVEKDGTVSEVEILNSLDKTYGLDQSAVEAFKQWRFQPGTIDGSPVRVMVTIDLTFTLRDTPVTQTWPEGFVPTRASDAVEETVDAEGIRLRIARPAGWNRRGLASEWIGLRTTDATQTLSVFPPQPATFEFQWPAPDQLIARVAESARRGQPIENAEILAVGQIRAANQFWIWTSLRLPRVPTAGQASDASPFAEARTWMFMGTVNGRVVGVGCTVLIPRGVEGAELEARVRKAAADFAPIIDSMRMEPVP